ncbi:MAG: sigma 54-interacting transcriptional regulator [Myxococcales bacterium]|nr:sigma 54-interacting transcriptional regulator [Myxococcales bacterium]
MAELVFLRRGEEVMRYQLDGMVTTIGRGGRNDIAFPEHEPYISREHASIEKRAGGFWLRDLSKDGLPLNGNTVQEGLLKDGDNFTLGKWQVRFNAKSDGMDFSTMTRGGGTLPVFDRERPSEVGESFLSFELHGDKVERPLARQALTIGSSPSNDLCLPMPYISSFHCRLYQRDGRYFLRDLDSKNGSWVNGLRTMESELPDGAEIFLGKFPLKFVVKKEEEKSDYPGFAGIISRDPVMEPIFEMIRRVAGHDATVLILGESGTGKELVARAIHEVSPRRNEPFRAINCGVIEKNLAGSELFGHEKGAFTGALSSRQGAFEEVGKGTLFLDEIGDLPFDQQVAFLRVLEVGTFRRVGGARDQSNQARVVTATHRDLWQLIREGLFREDLYHRVGVLPITLPPLRARVQDISLLARFFLKRFAQHRDLQLSEDALLALQSYHWPGNVRELRNVMQRAIVMVNGNEITAADLHIRPSHTGNAHQMGASTPYPGPEAFASPSHGQLSALPVGAAYPPPKNVVETSGSLDDTERLAIIQALENCRGSVTEAAKRLEIGRSSLYSKMKRHGIISGHYKSR